MMAGGWTVLVFDILLGLLVVAVILSSSTVLAGAPCKHVVIANSMYQKSMEGTYTQYTGGACVQGTTVWANEGQSIFIYYVNLAKYSVWIIGPGLCNDIASIFATTYYYAYPYSTDMTGQWYEVDYMGNPSANSYLTVTCSDGPSLSVGAIAGVIIACISALILILIVVICCCSAANHKRNRVQGVGPQSAVGVVGSDDYQRYHDPMNPYGGYPPPQYGPPLAAPGQWAMNVLPMQAPPYEDVHHGGPPSPPPAYHAFQTNLPTTSTEPPGNEGAHLETEPETGGVSIPVGPMLSQSIGGYNTPSNDNLKPVESAGLTPAV